MLNSTIVFVNQKENLLTFTPVFAHFCSVSWFLSNFYFLFASGTKNALIVIVLLFR